jgi:hypothetical protein
MPLLPYLKYEVISQKTPGEVQAALRTAVEPRRFLRFGAGTRPFEGEVEDHTFDLQRIIGYRNSFLPRIRGTIDAIPEGSRISVTMKLHPFVLVFLMAWLGFAAVGCGALLISSLRGSGPAFGAVGPAVMFVLGWAMAAGGFTFEERRATRLLADVMMTRPSARAGQLRVATDGAAPRS